ncbi:hypothetical protein GcC1_087033 [Golovinomyces cichoracearum]|uniref:HTH psq-type domain-containing protein n=1 Tax=Golovinomyces cichoracearum TaxID=62708 RepID=A0A420IHK4_9PEZI|nr:hypothetical protein GcC1_087033 [Golovinomyces cichoracearum]
MPPNEAVLEQAIRDYHDGQFRSIQATARVNGVPGATLRCRLNGI